MNEPNPHDTRNGWNPTMLESVFVEVLPGGCVLARG